MILNMPMPTYPPRIASCMARIMIYAKPPVSTLPLYHGMDLARGLGGGAKVVSEVELYGGAHNFPALAHKQAL